MMTCRRCGRQKEDTDFPFDKRFVNDAQRRTICYACLRIEKQDEKRSHVGLPWDQNEDILFRLDMVATLMIQGARPYEIAKSLGYSWDTAKRDCDRVRELWRRNIGIQLHDLRAAAQAQYQEILTRLWHEFNNTDKGDTKTRMLLFREIRATRQAMDDIEGTQAPKQVHVGIRLSDAAQRALDDLEKAGVNPDDLYREFENFILAAAEEQMKRS